MSLAMSVVWSDRHRLHEPGGEVWVGVRTPGTELPARAELIREALAEAGARLVDADPQPDDAVLRVHDPALVAFLATAWERWEAEGLTADRVRTEWFRTSSPNPASSPRAGRPPRPSRRMHGPDTSPSTP